MDVNTRNTLFASGQFDRADLWPKITEYEHSARTFRFQFGLDELPTEPGILLIRGPRQYGKSTWLELALRDTLEDFGKGSAFFLNGDEILDADELENAIRALLASFNRKSKVRRIFIDEITAILGWERALKRLADRGEIRDVLVVTTGSRAADIRHGSERLPGRKGKLGRTEYLFTGISYKDFHAQLERDFDEKDAWIAYLLSGGSPVAAKEIWQMERVPEYCFEIARDWVLGELARTGRSRPFVLATLRTLFRHGGGPLGYLKLARESGLANNTIAAEYIEQLTDLLSVLPSPQWDSDRKVPLQKKPCKFHFVNLSVALAFAPQRLATVGDFKALPPTEQARWMEWLVAQELFRRQCIAGGPNAELLGFWASKSHELDFVDANERYYEVKLGKTGPLDFAWFEKTHPGKKLLVISQTPFETRSVRGITLHQFLLADGLPHPYPGQVDDPDVFNEWGRFET